MKSISCGVIIINNNKVLACKPYGKKQQQLGYDIPKGKMEEEEAYWQTALRELKEETGILLSEDDIYFVGNFKYTKKKDLILYLSEEIVDISQCCCYSSFEMYEKIVPEIVSYAWIEDSSMFYPNLQPIVEYVLKRFKKN